jgi:DNA-binding HxlR family transcriptional regulator
VVPPKVEYSLTPKGETTVPIIDSLRKWGAAVRDGELETYQKKSKPRLRKGTASR